MYKLQVEELESRQLLNGTNFLPQAPTSLSLTAFTHSLITAEYSSVIDYEGHTAAFGLGWPDEGGVEITMFRIIFSPNQGGRDAVLPGSAHQGPAAAWLELEGGDVRLGADRFAPRPAGAGGPAAALLINGAVPPVPLDAPSSTRGANAASAEAIFALLSGRPDSQPHLLPGDPGGGGGLPALVQSLASKRSPSYTVPVKEGASGVPGVLAEEGGRGDSGFGAAAAIKQEKGSVLPSPQVSELLAVLPPADLSGLEVGIQEFLKGLERLTPYLAGDAGGTRLWPWIVALAAAATACEIARRELRANGRFADGRNERNMSAEWG